MRLQPRNSAMVSRVHSGWQDISELTRRMLVSARAGDWVAVATLEAKRQQHLNALEGVEPGKHEPDRLAQFQQLLDDDRELLRLAAVVRGELEQQLAELSQGRRALAAYGQAGKTT